MQIFAVVSCGDYCATLNPLFAGCANIFLPFQHSLEGRKEGELKTHLTNVDATIARSCISTWSQTTMRNSCFQSNRIMQYSLRYRLCNLFILSLKRAATIRDQESRKNVASFTAATTVSREQRMVLLRPRFLVYVTRFIVWDRRLQLEKDGGKFCPLRSSTASDKK